MNQAAIGAWAWARVEANWEDGEMLVLGVEAHEVWGGREDVWGWQAHRGCALGWDEQMPGRRFEVLDDAKRDCGWENVLVLGGKSREEMYGWIAQGWDLLCDGGRLMVAVANDLGAARYEKDCRGVFGELEIYQKSKCRVFSFCKLGVEMPVEVGEWLEMGRPREIVGYGGWVGQAGVFSSKQMDGGSELLIANFPADLRGRVADLGAGWGALAGAACARFPKLRTVDLFEVDARALACARENLREYGERVRFFWCDVTREGAEDEYDAVLCNPPFHEGQKTDVGLGRAFLQRGVSLLKKGGRMLLVANRQLPYEEELSRLGVSWRAIAENAMYKILVANKR